MPRYEMALIFKTLTRPEMIQAVKRTSETLLERGAIIRGFENHGLRKLPYRMSKHGLKHNEGTYFTVNFDAPGDTLKPLKEHLHQDLDIIRPNILRAEKELRRPCEDGPCDFGELDDEKRKRLLMNMKKYVKKL